MVIKPEERVREVRPRMRGGEGEARLAWLPAEALAPHVRLVSEITLSPGSGIGAHTHEGEAEYFIILEGSAAAEDDGAKVLLKPGDCLVTKAGHSHGVMNPGPAELKMLALIVTEA